MKRFVKKLLIFAAACVVCALAAEVVLRVIDRPSLVPGLYELHDSRGWTLRADVSKQHTSEGNALVETNEHGFRDLPRSYEKPEGVFRVAVLGDSFIEAKEVALEDSFTRQLESQLQQCQPNRVEVLNFGVQGYGTAQQLLLLREEVLRYAPDLVVLAFFPANDFYDNHIDLNPSNAELAPYFVVSQTDGSLQQVPAKRGLSFVIRKQLLRWSNYSRVLKLLWRSGLSSLFTSRSAANKVRWHRELGADYQEWLAAREPQVREMSEAWLVTEKLIHQVNREVLQHDAQFQLLVLSTAIQVHLDEMLQRRFQRKFRVSSMNFAGNRLNDFARRMGIPILNLVPGMREHAIKHNQLLHGFENAQLGFGHWNENGHRVASRIFAESLCAELKSKP